jgi:hypothetical protein
MRHAFVVAIASGVLSSGCGDDTSGGDGAPDGGAPGALYAVTTTVFDDTVANTYVALLGSLENQQVDLAAAREFAGWSSVATHDGAILVGHGDRPEVTRYPIGDGGTFGNGDDDLTVSFASYGLTTASLAFNTVVDDTMAHMALNQTSRILWDPTTMTILDDVDTPEVAAERDGLAITAANFQGRVVRPDGVFQAFFWHDVDWYAFHQQSQIAVHGRDGRLDTLLDVPCPALQIATTDEDGNVYFSGMVDTILHQLLEPASAVERCVARIDAGSHAVADGWPRRFEELTGGRPAGVFQYLADGVGILTVYHVENADPAAATFRDTMFSENWGLWLVDLEGWQAAPIEGWPLGPANIFFSRADGRLFVHQVAAGFTSTTISEIAIDGTFRQQLTVPGYSAYPLLRVR